MAKFRQVSLHIDRSSFPMGSVCSIHYEYFLTFEQSDLDAQTIFQVYCELWGVNTIREKRLSDEPYDPHEFKATHSMDLSRAFGVQCKLLNERLGEDFLFIKLKLIKNGELIDEMRSDEVHDRF